MTSSLQTEGMNAYFQSLAWPIEHFFRNPVAYARMAHLGMFPPGYPVDYQGWKQQAVEGWKMLLDSNKPEHGNYTQKNLVRLVTTAEEGDWSDMETIVRLYELHAELDGEPFEREKVFPSK